MWFPKMELKVGVSLPSESQAGWEIQYSGLKPLVFLQFSF